MPANRATRSERSAASRCRNCAETRSKVTGVRVGSVFGRASHWVSHCRTSSGAQLIRPAAAGDAARACAAARSRATGEMSTASTFQPCSASHSASAPSPQPMSRAEPGARPVICSTSRRFGRPLQMTSAEAYRSSQNARPCRAASVVGAVWSACGVMRCSRCWGAGRCCPAPITTVRRRTRPEPERLPDRQSRTRWLSAGSGNGSAPRRRARTTAPCPGSPRRPARSVRRR